METFYIEPDKFWEIFNKNDDLLEPTRAMKNRYRQPTSMERNREGYEANSSDLTENYGKRIKKSDHKPPRVLAETEAAFRSDTRYAVLWGRHKPGKKTKNWEGDGFLSFVGQMAHLSDDRGRMLEDPAILDDIDYKTVKELGEILIGDTEVQVVELEK